MTNYANIRYQPAAASTTTVADMAALIALTGMSNGDQALVQATNKLYMYSGTGWYLIATIQNDAPSAITGVSGTYELAVDGTVTTITAASTDPEGFPLTWSYSTSGLGSIASVSQSDNVFTITPSTTEADAGTFTLTINATDGINGAVSTTTNLTLEFIVIVANSKYTTLLATAVDISDNNNITDTSSNNHSITVNGDAHAGTFSPYRSGGYSTYFDGNDYLTTTQTTPLGTADFTIEGWVNFDNVGGNRTFMTLDSTTQLYFRNNGSSIAIYKGGSAYNFSTGTPEVNTWYHFAFVRQSGSVTLYWSGQSTGSTSHAHDYTSGNLHIGCWSAISEFFQGHLMDIKISNTAVYTSNFSVPTERLSSDSSTKLLICHLPYIADGSNLNETIAVNGDPTTKPFSPYDNLGYSAADHGGSVYFDGTGDYLVASNNTDTFGTGDFTLEGWIYRTATGATWQSIVAQRNGASTSVNEFVWGIHNSGYMYFYTGAHVASTSTGVIKLNQWHHIAFTRSGSTLRQFVDGIQQVSGTSSNNLTYGPMSIGNNNGGSELLTAFLSDIKTTKGTALYTSNFTPPTEPISSANSLLHIKGTDASIIDKSQINNIKMNGPTTGSTTKSAFGSEPTISFASGSNTNRYLEFDPTVLKFMEILGQPSIPFTIEGIWGWQGSTASPIFEIFQDTNNFFYFGGGTGNTQSGITTDMNLYAIFKIGGVERFKMTAGIGSYYNVGSSFKHQAITRNSSGLMQHYYDGQLRTNTITHSGYDTVNWASPAGYVGRSDWMGAYGRYEGYIHQIRLTVGLARYTANFTPPTASLEG